MQNDLAQLGHLEANPSATAEYLYAENPTEKLRCAESATKFY